MKIDITRPLDLSALAPADTVTPVAGGAAADQVDRFNMRLRETGSTESVEGPGGAAESYAAGTEGVVGSLGDAILRRMSEVSSRIRDNWQAIADGGLSNGAVVDAQDIIRFQMTVVETAIQYELLGKTVTKGEQIVEQLVKMQ